uniref:Similar to n=1 Tax=Panagrellus redivivus TaxID=6233 RepID=A0A7E4USB3_PANRE
MANGWKRGQDTQAAYPMDESTSSAEAFYDAITPESYAHYDDIYGASFALADDFNQPSTSASAGLLENEETSSDYSRPGSSRSMPTSSPAGSSTGLASAMRPSSIDYLSVGESRNVPITPPPSVKTKRKLRFNIPQSLLSSSQPFRHEPAFHLDFRVILIPFPRCL